MTKTKLVFFQCKEQGLLVQSLETTFWKSKAGTAARFIELFVSKLKVIGFALLVFVPNVYAEVSIARAGCYLVKGEIASLEKTAINLIINGGSRGEENIRIDIPSADLKFLSLKKGYWIASRVYSASSGPLNRTRLIGSMASTSRSQPQARAEFEPVKYVKGKKKRCLSKN